MHVDRETRVLPYGAASRTLWGDDASGRSIDWVYALDDEVCHIVFGIPAGSGFTHFGDTVAVYERDVLWRVLAGVLMAVDPRTGETHRVERGESLVFDGTVWPHGFNAGAEMLRVVEFTAPSRERAGDAVELRRAQSAPEYPRFRAAVAERSTLRVLRDADIAWQVRPGGAAMAVGELFDSPHLTVGELHVGAGRTTEPLVDDGPKTLHVLDGRVAVLLDGRWLEAGPEDGVYIAAGTPHRFAALCDGPVKALFQVAGSGGADAG